MTPQPPVEELIRLRRLQLIADEMKKRELAEVVRMTTFDVTRMTTSELESERAQLVREMEEKQDSKRIQP